VDQQEPAEDGLLALSEKAALNDQIKDIPKPQKAPTEEDPSGGFSYLMIRGFQVDGDKSTTKGKSECEKKCSINEACLAYCFKASDNTCVVSEKALSYNPSWEFFARGLKIDGAGNLVDSHVFHGFPGLFADGFETKEPVDLEICREGCEANPQCKSFSFRKSTKTCKFAESGVKYDPEFEYYENEQRVSEHPQEDALTSKQRKLIQAGEAQMALQDRKVRLRKVAREQAAKQVIKKQQALVAEQAAEADAKTKAREEQKSEAKRRQKQLTKNLAAAEVRGEYAETVHKSHQNVQQAAIKVNKEKEAKAQLTKQKSEQASETNEKTNAQQAAERSQKKQISLNQYLDRQTFERANYLRLRATAFEVKAKATELAAEQRSFMGPMDPAQEERERTEEELLHTKQTMEAQLKQAKETFAAISKRVEAEKKIGEKNRELKALHHKTELAQATKESEEKINEARLPNGQ
jgi:hypothetical protein